MGLSYQVFDAIGREQCPSVDNDRAKLAKKNFAPACAARRQIGGAILT
jgi:hypothetical protein